MDGAGFGQVCIGVFAPGDKPAVRNLDSDGPLQLLIVSEVNQSKAAFAQDSLDPVATDSTRLSGNLVHG